eukprot:Gregarina_sp_Pseudo_9__1914@NODE_2314_length_1044_cov_35_080597_g2130_i0_p1_GENE_NODE_2314_length_1044_cov_35_080597_g2130_i0NODE_2314_length_1044_cov_35_080597_g2130_i0_p1_ORF_typecomplete_len316_score48_88Atthog/PF18800_1/7_5e02Atthog/PF18800_1/0_12Atthog/PF18800_1/8_6e03PrsWprotease/PF13367_6/2_1e03PrsWprotease/PF13367_6/0_09PrsWprotease/PF13367_6/9_3e02YibE_F/PF07907_11/0_26YibE_F/PF07907_11/1_1e03_NODE_2314_length_1044_cov_35_080597_g2130_i032979
MYRILEDVYVCLALFVAIGCVVIFITNIRNKRAWRIYEATVTIECVVCTAIALLETRRRFRRKSRSIGLLATVSACCRGIVFAFGFHYLWNFSSFGDSTATPRVDYPLVENLVFCCFIGLGIGFLNCLKKHVCLPRKSEQSLFWEFAFGWSLSESLASLQCEASIGICLMMFINDWRRRRLVDVLILPKPMDVWTPVKFLVFMSRLLIVPLVLRFLYTMNLARLDQAYVYENRLLLFSLVPLAFVQILIGAWFGLADPHHLQVFAASMYLALLLLSNFLLNVNKSSPTHTCVPAHTCVPRPPSVTVINLTDSRFA